MKSKRALEHICTYENVENSYEYVGYENIIARESVELAEQDARDKAIKAYCNGYNCLQELEGCNGKCQHLQNFLKYYDKNIER